MSEDRLSFDINKALGINTECTDSSLKSTKDQLFATIEELGNKIEHSEVSALKAEIEKLKEFNIQLQCANKTLTDRVNGLTDEVNHLKAQLDAMPTGPRRTDEPPKDGTVILAKWSYKYVEEVDMSVAYWGADIDMQAWCDVCNDDCLNEKDPDWWAEIKTEVTDNDQRRT